MNTLLHPVAIRERILRRLLGAAKHVLRVLVVAHQEVDVESGQALVAGNDVGGDLLVRGAEMRTAVDVVDRGRQKERSRSFSNGMVVSCWRASCLDLFIGRPCSAASRTQSSNSGCALKTRPLRRATLKRTVPSGVVDRHHLALQALARHLGESHANRRGLAKHEVDERSALAGRATIVISVPGRFFFICTGE